MIKPDENYEQEKIKGDEKQIVILDEAETGETDELDPKFHEDESLGQSTPDREPIPQNDGLDGEGIDERLAGLNSDKEEDADSTSTNEDLGLNHGSDDDVSLNKPDEGIF